MTIDEAWQFLNWNIKEGIWPDDKFDGWTDQQIIKFAEQENSYSEMMYDYWLETQREIRGDVTPDF